MQNKNGKKKNTKLKLLSAGTHKTIRDRSALKTKRVLESQVPDNEGEDKLQYILSLLYAKERSKGLRSTTRIVFLQPLHS